jgi:atypical dual specificity phosphatase
MVSLIGKLVVYPSLYYGMTLEYLGLRTWYTRIDEHCVLGALPMKHNYQEIVEKENIKAVLTMNEDHELVYSISKPQWKELNVSYMQMAIADFVGVPNLEQIKQCMEFIDTHKKKNECVYVHCKAGRYRSATIVACYLIKERKMLPYEVINHLKQLRPSVVLDRPRQLNAMNNYYDHLYSKKD